MKQTKAIKIFLGWDGSYVLSREPLKKLKHPNADSSWDGYYLTPSSKLSCIDIDAREGDIVFKKLGLKMLDVVELEIRPKALKRTRR